MVHSDKSGILENIMFSDEIQKYILEKHIYIHKGESISAYTGSNKTIGELILKFDNRQRLQSIFEEISNHVLIKYK